MATIHTTQCGVHYGDPCDCDVDDFDDEPTAERDPLAMTRQQKWEEDGMPGLAGEEDDDDTEL